MTAVDEEQRAGYLQLFRQPGVIAIAAYSVLGRLPLGMTTVLLVLLFQSQSGSYAEAGIAVAVNSIAFAATSPWFGRLADRGHARAVLIVIGCLQPLAMGLLVLAVTSGWPTGLELACAALAGAVFPPIASITRERWSFVLPRHLHTVAYGLEALLTEVLYIVGPLVATLALLLAGPGVGLVASAVFVAIGCLLLASTPAMRERAVPPPDAARVRGRLLTGPVVAIVSVAVGLGLAFGVLEVAIPAFAIEAGSEVLSAVLLATWSIASVIGGILWIRVRLRWSIQAQLVLLVSLNIAGFAVFGLAGSVVGLAVLLLVQGLVMAPAVAAEFTIVGRVAPAGRVTETFTWLNTGAYVGGAIGSAAGGLLIEPIGVDATLSASALFALVALAGAVASLRLRRRSLPTPSPSTSS